MFKRFIKYILIIIIISTWYINRRIDLCMPAGEPAAAYNLGCDAKFFFFFGTCNIRPH